MCAELAQAIDHRRHLVGLQLAIQDLEYAFGRTVRPVMIVTSLVDVFAHMIEIQHTRRVRVMRQCQTFDPGSTVADQDSAAGIVEA